MIKYDVFKLIMLNTSNMIGKTKAISIKHAILIFHLVLLFIIIYSLYILLLSNTTIDYNRLNHNYKLFIYKQCKYIYVKKIFFKAFYI